MGEKHTPGEWRVEPDMRSEGVGDMYAADGFREYLAGWNIVSDAGEIVGCEGIIPGSHAEADAHLMAASKDLLVVARMVVARMVVEASELAGFSGPLGDAARTAIAKATPTDTKPAGEGATS